MRNNPIQKNKKLIVIKMAFKKVVIGAKGFNFLTYPKMGSSNIKNGIIQKPKKTKGSNPNGRKKTKKK